jgi:uncharacterized cofD-like protein
MTHRGAERLSQPGREAEHGSSARPASPPEPDRFAAAGRSPGRRALRRISVVAFGGGHGLGATLRALRLQRGRWLTEGVAELAPTAVVTVGDNGGSSGRLRADRGALPPGDLRQALVALADVDRPLTGTAARLFQHRFAGTDSLAGHPVGNLVLCGLIELSGDPVAALDQAGAMLGCCGRVLPMSREPVGIEADVRGADPERPDEVVTVRGQHEVAVTAGQVDRVRLTPAAPVVCAEAVTAIEGADWLLFGPGSWYTSVIPHLLVPGLAEAVAASRARRLVMLNLAVEKETLGLSLSDHLAALARYHPGLRVDFVLADGKAVGDPEPVHRAAESLGARLVLAPVAVPDGAPRHDTAALAVALEPLLGAT